MSECIHEIWCPITNDEKEGKCRIFVGFNDCEQAEALSEYGYDEVVHHFNEVMPEGWYVDDVPECEADADVDIPHITINLGAKYTYTVNRKLTTEDIIPIN